jgi:dynein heavy chain
MKAYRVEVNKYEAERQELANAEKLFDLPITMYPDLQQVQKQMKGLEMIYALYEEQQVKKSHSQYSLNCYII